MPLIEVWFKAWIYLGFVCGWTGSARPQFDTSTDMGLVLVPMDAEIDSVIFRLRATDQDADFPLMFEITAAVMPIVRVENLPCTLYNKVCQANVILTKRLIPGRLHDFAVRVRDSKGDTNSMQATISVTNATTPRDKIFPHIPSLIMVPEDAKPGKELDYLLVRSNPWSGKPVYIELWQPKELFTIRQRQTPAQTRGTIMLIGELDFETQSMYTLTMYATDPYTEPGKDTRNIAGLHVVVVVQDVQDVPPVFTIAPPLTRINNSIQPGEVILRVHAEDGDKGAPREITYGLVSEGNPFTPFFNISETTGEIILARPLEELIQITHVRAPVVLSVVAEEIRRSKEEAPAQATVVELGLLLGEPGNRPPYFENDNYMAWMDENAKPDSVVMFIEPYSTKVKDEDVGKAGVFTLKLDNNNGTFEISPTVAERTANFVITVRDNTLIDYETYKSLRFKIIAQEVGPMTNLSASVLVTIFLRDINDNPPEFDQETYEVTLSENVTAGTKVIQVHATDKDTGLFGSIQYTRIIGPGNEAFTVDSDTGLITVAAGATGLDREITPKLQLSVEARDEDGRGLKSTVSLIVNLLDVNDNAPVFVKDSYEFTLNSDLTNITMPASIKAIDADSEAPNNEIRYELIHGNYENKFHLNEVTGELILREPVNKMRRARPSAYQHFAAKFKRGFLQVQETFQKMAGTTKKIPIAVELPAIVYQRNRTRRQVEKIWKYRKKRDDDDALYTLTARAYDLGVPHLSSTTKIRIISGTVAGARTVMFVVPGEHPDPIRTAETLAAITGGRVTIQEIRLYVPQNQSKDSENGLTGGEGGKKSIVVARVEHTPGTSLVDIERIRETLAANGVGIIGGMDTVNGMKIDNSGDADANNGGNGNVNSNGGVGTNSNNINKTITSVHSEEVTVYKAENKLLIWLLVFLGLLMALAALTLILCCICPGCPFYMAPRKRRVRSSETLIVHSDGRPKRHLYRKQAKVMEVWPEKKQAWSADLTKRNWQFNRRNTNNRGLASLPGDLANVPQQAVEAPTNAASLRLRDGPAPTYIRDPIQRHEEERIYIEDVEGQEGRCYDLADMDSLRRHELERGSDIRRPGYRYVEQRSNDEVTKFVREQHFYRDGNAEVLRLVTRGQLEGDVVAQMPTTVTVDQQPNVYRGDGKNILLQRFIEDQKIKHVQDLRDKEIRGNDTGSQQYPRETIAQQQEIILLPDQLDRENVQHFEELTPTVQRLIIDRNRFDEAHREELEESKVREAYCQQQAELTVAAEAAMIVGGAISKAVENPSSTSKVRGTQSLGLQPYSIHEIKLARQNALLTQLLLERESKGVGGTVLDTASFLETQSLPGQIATATQTDRTAGTQTEYFVKSRSDNDESEEEIRLKRRLKFKKRYGDSELKRMKMLWMRSPIEEENQSFTENRINALRRKAKETREGRKVTLEPEVLREISDSLDDNGSSVRDDEPIKSYRYITRDVIMRHRAREEANQSRTPSSPETDRGGYRKVADVMERKRERTMEDFKVEGNLEKQAAPSFRILEKEITSLRRQVRKMGDGKLQDGANRQDKKSILEEYQKKEVLEGNVKGDFKKGNVDSKTLKRRDFKAGKSKVNPEQSSFEVISTDEVVKSREEKGVKAKRMLKYQQGQRISTESLEFDDAFDKSKKHSSEMIQATSQKQQLSTAKQEDKKRESKDKSKKHKKEDASPHTREIKKRKENTSQESSKLQSDFGKQSKDLASVHNRNNMKSKVIKSQKIGTNLDRAESKKERTELQQDFDKRSTTDDLKKELIIGQSDFKEVMERYVSTEDSREEEETNGKKDKKGHQNIDTSVEISLESSNRQLEYEKKEIPTRQSSERQTNNLTKSPKIDTDNEKIICDKVAKKELDKTSTVENLKDFLTHKIVENVENLEVGHYSEADGIDTLKKVDKESDDTLTAAQSDEYREPRNENFPVEMLNEQSDKEISHQGKIESTIKVPISSEINIHQGELKKFTESPEPSTSKDNDASEKENSSIEKVTQTKNDDRKQNSTEIQYRQLQESSSNPEENVEPHYLSTPENKNDQINTRLEKHDESDESGERPRTFAKDEIDTNIKMLPSKTMESDEDSRNKSVLQEGTTSAYEDNNPRKESSSFNVLSDIDASSDRKLLEEKVITEGKEILPQTTSVITDFITSKSKEPQNDKSSSNLFAKETHQHSDFVEKDDFLDSTKNLVESKIEEEDTKLRIQSPPYSSSAKDAMENSSDSDSSSDSSSKTMLNAQPYQTPRHRSRNLSREENIEFRDTDDSETLRYLTVPKENIQYKLQDTVSLQTANNEYRYESEANSNVRLLLGSAIQPIALSEVINEKEDVTLNKDIKKQEHLVQSSIVKDNFEEHDVKKKTDLNNTVRQRQDNESNEKKESKLKSGQGILKDSRDISLLFDERTNIDSTEDIKKVSQNRGKRKPYVDTKKVDKKKDGTSEAEADLALKRKKVTKEEKNKGRILLRADLKKSFSDKVEKAGSVLRRKGRENISEKDLEENKTNEPHVASISPTKDSKCTERPNEKESKQTSNKDELDALKQSKKVNEADEKQPQPTKSKTEKNVIGSGTEKTSSPPKIDSESNKVAESNANQSRYMSCYKKKREEMEKKRREKKEAEEEEQRPRWMRRSTIKKATKEVKIKEKSSASRTSDVTPRARRKVKPLVNVESEQLKAIVRQGRKLRKAEGAQNEDPPVEIFAPEKRPTPTFSTSGMRYHPSMHHLEYMYERIPPPFYLHPPPVPHSSPQFSPEHFQGQFSENRRPDDDLDSGIAVSLQGGTRLRHQQLLEKKSVFDIAYNEAAPSQLRADSTTPPS